MSGLGAHYELIVSCRGEINPTLGYLINIKEIDQAVRSQALPILQQAMNSSLSRGVPPVLLPLPEGGGRGVGSVLLPLPEGGGWGEGAATRSAPVPPVSASPTLPNNPILLLPILFRALTLPNLHSLRWNLTPYYSVEMTATAPTTVLLRQKFDFCAAHRLHAPALSPEENRKLFGKCNNPSGHGHNYQFEPCIALTLSPPHLVTPSSPPFSLSDLEHLADSLIVQRFDHKNLNTDTEEFRDAAPGKPGGLNPSVENIAKVCFNLLAPALRGQNAKLQSVTVWESDRTSCTYPG